MKIDSSMNSISIIITGSLIELRIPYDIELIKEVRKIPGRKWNNIKKVWEIPYNRKILEMLRVKFVISTAESHMSNIFPLHQRELQLRKYSTKTMKSYMFYNKSFLDFANKSEDNIDQNDIRNFLYHMAFDKKSSASTLNSIMNALRFYFGNVKGKLFIYEIPRTKKDKKLPVIFSKKKIQKILTVQKNKKHIALLSLIYSAGLRFSEAATLQLQDIDRERKILHIKGAKGKKDRYTLLSSEFLKKLEYMLCGTVLQRIFLRMELTCVIYSNCWVMKAVKQPKYIPM